MADAMSETEATAWISTNGFHVARPRCIGVELEWIVRDRAGPARPPIAHLLDMLHELPEPLPGGSRISFEPGGQLEISSAPANDLASCITQTMTDLRLVRNALARAGIWLEGRGLDTRSPERMVDLPRYAVLEAHYDMFGPYGRTMMCNTASVQVSVDAGDDSNTWRGRRARWWLANALGPVLISIFANSPGPSRSGWRSARQVYRFRTDPTRTEPFALSADPLSTDPAQEWAQYALGALVVGLRDRRDRRVRLSMRDWLRGHGPRPVVRADLARHLKTVIPPVRPCGHLELRMIDAQAADDWVVPVAVVSALMDDHRAAERVAAVLSVLPMPQRSEDWLRAAHHGLADAELARAALACVDIALTSLMGSRLPDWILASVVDFVQRYTARRRCPADAYGSRMRPAQTLV
jgi:glutamate--cysteine ligase